MAVNKTDLKLPFAKLYRGSPFAFTTTIYSLSGGVEQAKEYKFFKLNAKKAITLDKRVTVHIPSTAQVIVCRMEESANKIHNSQKLKH